SEWLFTWGVGHGLWSQSVAWQEVGTSLLVEPRLLGDGTIHVTLTPRFDYRVGGAAQTVDVNELSTEVVVRPGEEVALGGVPFRGGGCRRGVPGRGRRGGPRRPGRDGAGGQRAVGPVGARPPAAAGPGCAPSACRARRGPRSPGRGSTRPARARCAAGSAPA